MSPQGRIEFIEKCFVSDVAERKLPGPIRRIIQSILVAAQNLTFIGYYSDPRSAEGTGYVPFSEREEGGPLDGAGDPARSRLSTSARLGRSTRIASRPMS